MDSVSHPEINTVSRRSGSGNHHAASDPVDDPQLILERPVRSSFPGNAKFVLVLLFVGFVVQTGAMLLLRRHATVNLLEADEQEYWGIASSLLHGGLKEFPVTRTLGFPLTIAAIRSVVGDSYFRVQFVLTSLLIFLAPLTYWLARAVLGSERAVRVSALGVLFWPVYLRLGVTLFSDNITLVLFVLYLNVFVSAWQSTGEERFPWCSGFSLAHFWEFVSIFGPCISSTRRSPLPLRSGTRKAFVAACSQARC